MEQKEKYETPTAEQIAEWKGKYRNVYELDVLGLPAYLRKPRLDDLELAMKAAAKPTAKALDFNRTIVQRCQLSIHPDIFDGDEREVALYTSVGELAALKDASIAKL